MKHIPFAKLSLAERSAVLAALQRCGVAPRQVCVSRIEPAFDDSLPGVTMVSAPGWVRSYGMGEDWLGELEQDLGSLARR
jgi:hypothetical protein